MSDQAKKLPEVGQEMIWNSPKGQTLPGGEVVRVLKVIDDQRGPRVNIELIETVGVSGFHTWVDPDELTATGTATGELNLLPASVISTSLELEVIHPDERIAGAEPELGPVLPEMSEDDIGNLAQEALNVAVAHIQQKMGIPWGDTAAVWFSDGDVEDNLREYIKIELNNKRMKSL
jgi:hypothetical protein